MNVKLVSKKENPLFKRDEARLEVEHVKSSTPDKKNLLANVSKVLNNKEENLIIKKIQTIFGKAKSIIHVNSYKNRKDLEAVEKKHLIKRNTFKEEKPAEEAKEEIKKDG